MTVLSCSAEDSESRGVRDLAPVLAALADPYRLRIVQLLMGGARTIDDLSDRCRLSPTELLGHLAPLTAAGIVARRRLPGGTTFRVARPGLVKWVLDGDSALFGGAPQAGR